MSSDQTTSPNRSTPADYFVLTAEKGAPRARLLIPLSREHSQPVRAELYLTDDVSTNVHDAYVEQARQLVRERYRTTTSGDVSLYILDIAPESGLPPAQIGSAPAEYFTLNDEDGESLASLLVPLDRQSQPAHAELYVAADLEVAAVDASIDQAHLLLNERYGIAAGPHFSLTVQRVDLRDVTEIALSSDAAAPIPPNAPVAAAGKAATASSKQDKPRNSRLPMIVIGVMIVALAVILGLLAMTGVLNFRSLGSVSSTDSATELAQADGGDGATGETGSASDAGNVDDESAAADQPAAEEPTATPFPGPPPEIRETYCIWPEETLSEIALNAGVSEDEILAVNPDFSGQAGTTILLPSNATPPDEWPDTRPVATSITDSPFGDSGYYLSYDNRTKRVALSFDIGFAEGNKELRELLADRGIRGTFFMLGGAVENHPEIIGEVLENGHELGNHSYTHENMLTQTKDQIAWELSVTESLVQNAYPGATTKDIFRAPFGAINDRVKEVAAEQGYHLVGWTVDSADWTDDITDDILYEVVTDRICPGAMIAMHDVNPANGPALPRILNYLDANGYEYVTVTELLFPDR